MRKALLLILIFLTSFTQAQLRLKVSDLNLAGTVIARETQGIDLNYVRSVSSDQTYLSETFCRSYSDTFSPAFRNRHGFSRGNPPQTGSGFSYWQTGVNIQLNLVSTQHPVLERIHLRLGCYAGSRRFFSYNMATQVINPTDTLDYSFKSVNYQYFNKQMNAELGLTFDIYRKKRFICYAGVLMGYGHGYQNELHVRQDEFEGYGTRPASTVKTIVKEPNSYSTRMSFTLGVKREIYQSRKISLGVSAEYGPGYEMYHIKGGRTIENLITPVSLGLRLGFISY